eukprot:429501_1
MSGDDKLFACGSGRNGDNCVYFYDVESRKQCEFQIASKQYVRADVVQVAISSDASFVATGHKDQAIWIWDLNAIKNGDKDAQKPVNFNKGMKYHNGLISSMQFSPDGKQLLTAAHDSNIYLFTNPTEGKNDNIHLDHAFTGLIRKAMFLTKDRIVAIGGDSTIRFFKIQPKQK